MSQAEQNANTIGDERIGARGALFRAVMTRVIETRDIW